MRNKIRELLKSLMPWLFTFIKGMILLYSKKSHLNTTGYMLSVIEEKPLDSDGNPIPWMNFNVVDFLKERLTKEMSLFEYGSGFSTQFYAKYAKNVISIEHDKGWFEIISDQVPDNCKVKYIKYNKDLRGGDYSMAIKNTDTKYNIVIVDGRDRVNCIKNSINNLTNDGIIILDDSSRKSYKSGFEFLSSKGFRYITFCGLKSTGIKEDCTTVFYKDGNCFGI